MAIIHASCFQQQPNSQCVDFGRIKKQPDYDLTRRVVNSATAAVLMQFEAGSSEFTSFSLGFSLATTQPKG